MDATRTPPTLQSASAMVLVLALLFGGGQGHLGDAVTQLAALLLIGLLVWRQPDIRQWPNA